MLFYKVGPTPSTWWGVLMTSTDGGKKWGNRRKLGKGPLGHLIGPVKNKPVQLADGAILCPSSTEFDGWRCILKLHATSVRPGRSLGLSTTAILRRHPTERVVSPERRFAGHVPQSATRGHHQPLADGGKTWSPMAASPLPNPNAGTDAVTLADGRQLIVYNHTVRGTIFPANRTMLNVAVSTDGKSWKPVLTLERAPGEYSYPAVIQARDGKVHVTYASNARPSSTLCWIRQVK